jgi:hypothetical protein
MSMRRVSKYRIVPSANGWKVKTIAGGRPFGPFESRRDARQCKASLEEREARELWRAYCRSGRKPDNIPENPDEVYADEWVSWTDWIGGYDEKV